MKTREIRYLSIICLSLFLLNFAHPFYVSVCQIDHNAKENSLEITFKIFTDDFERALEAQKTGKLYLGSERESKDANRYIFNYLKKNFKLSIDEQEFPLKFLGKEVELDVIWCYAEVLGVKKISKISITNSLLIEQFESQSNIVHIKIGDTQKSMLLHRNKIHDSVEF